MSEARTDAAAFGMEDQGPAWRRFFGNLVRSPKGMTGFLVIILVLLTALFAPLIAPHDPTSQAIAIRFLPAFIHDGGGLAHLLGGDHMGRDVLSRVILGTRTSVMIAVMVISVIIVVGTTIGLVSGYFGGIVDSILMRLVDFQLSFPFILLAILLMAIFGPGFWTLVAALTLAFWVNIARLVRGETLKIKELEFVQAARGIGVGPLSIIFKHILPNTLPAITILATLDIAVIIISEAAMSFIGLGIQPPTPSWGVMISDGRNYLLENYWITLGPGLAIMITAVGINLFGDFIRDTYDPRLEQS